MNKNKVITVLFALSLTFTPALANDVSDIFSPENNIEFVQEDEQNCQTLKVFEPIVICAGDVIFRQVSRRVDLIDPASTGYYPGGRGPNKLVVYTASYGEHTQTNECGTEAIVEGNIVTSLSGADSAIPKDGIVISGHGTAKNWISQNIGVGSKVYVDTINRTITVYTTSESYTYDAKAKINEASSIVNYYKQSMNGYNPKIALGHIENAQNYLEKAQNSKNNLPLLKQYSQSAIDEGNMAIKTALPYMQNELKGVWVRPTETTQEQIIATLDKMKDNGFNNVFLETYYHGKTIFPSKTMNKYGFTVQNELFEGFNPLKIWVDEAHKRGMKVHTWFQSFYVGNKNPNLTQTSILAQHPEWGNKTKKCADCYGATMSVSEHNGYFLDPANPNVQEFLLELLSEIITDYKPDGINLDYIRYPNSNPRNDMCAWGFSEYARNEFKSQYGKDPAELTISDALWYDWNVYRRNIITNFVKKAGELAKENNTYVSAVIFPDIASALSSKQQDWRSWSTNGYIDGFTPLFLTYDSKMLASMMNDVMNIKSPETELYAGLFVTFMGGSSEDLIRQIFETRKMNANGVILFDYAHTTPVYTTTLMASAFDSTSQSKKIKAAQKKKFARKKKDNKNSSSDTKTIRKIKAPKDKTHKTKVKKQT